MSIDEWLVGYPDGECPTEESNVPIWVLLSK